MTGAESEGESEMSSFTLYIAMFHLDSHCIRELRVHVFLDPAGLNSGLEGPAAPYTAYYQDGVKKLHEIYIGL